MDNDTKSQSDKFKDLAREVEADDDEAAFDHVLGRIAKNRPVDDAKTPEQATKRQD